MNGVEEPFGFVKALLDLPSEKGFLIGPGGTMSASLRCFPIPNKPLFCRVRTIVGLHELGLGSAKEDGDACLRPQLDLHPKSCTYP